MSYQILLASTTWWRSVPAVNPLAGQKRKSNTFEGHQTLEGATNNNALSSRLGNESKFSRTSLEITNNIDYQLAENQRRVIYVDLPEDLNKNRSGREPWEKDPHGYSKWIQDRLEDPDLEFIAALKMPSMESRNLRSTMLQRMYNIKEDGDT